MSGFGPFVLPVLIILGYLFLKSRLSAAVQPIRFELLKRADRLLSRGDLTEDDRRIVEFAVENVFDLRVAWSLAVGFLPYWLYSRVAKKLSGKEAYAVPARGPNGAEMVAFERLYVIAVMGNSPAAAALFVLALLISLCTYVPFKSAMDLLLVEKSSHRGRDRRLTSH